MAHGTLLPNQETRLSEMMGIAAEMTDPDRGKKKSPKAVVKIAFWDGYPREFSLELSERTIVGDEFKQKKPGD